MALLLNYTKNKVYYYNYRDNDKISKQQTYPNAYLQITSLEGNKEKVKILLTAYTDETKQNIVDYKHYTFTPSVTDGSENFIAQGYEYLKTLPEFADAVDC